MANPTLVKKNYNKASHALSSFFLNLAMANQRLVNVMANPTLGFFYSKASHAYTPKAATNGA